MTVENFPGLQDNQHMSVISFLRPRYRAVLRGYRRVPFIFRSCGQLSLLACFAISLCAAACMFQWADEIFKDSVPTKDSQVKLNKPKHSLEDRLSVSSLKGVLEQRGVATDLIIEREELDWLLEETGTISTEELEASETARIQANLLDISQSSDVKLFRKVVLGQWDPYNIDSTMETTESIVFDSESAFVERVDDNKDSVWLLAVIANEPTHRTTKDGANVESIINGEIWGHLVHRYKPFGFKLGLIDCHWLQSICHDRGFIAADLVLALPKGGDRVKDLVQFRPYPRQSIPAHASRTTYPTSTVIQNVRAWLSSVLAERVRRMTLVEQILPASLRLTGTVDTEPRLLNTQWSIWMHQRPQPLHVLWRPRLQQRASVNNADQSPPPMALSALSVPYTGRVRFWTITNTTSLSAPEETDSSTSSSPPSWPATQNSITSPDKLLEALSCPIQANILILTPEAKCLAFGEPDSGEYLSYSNLELSLRFLYPSADDSLLLLGIVVNLLIFLNSAIDFGRVLALLRRHWNGHVNSIHDQGNSHSSMVRMLLGLARRGWTSHTLVRQAQDNGQDSDDVTPPRDNDLPPPTSPVQQQQCIVRKQLVPFFQSVVLDLFSVNFLLLISILPLVNILSHPQASSVVNPLLWTLRFFTTSAPLVALRLSITKGHLTLIRFLTVLLFVWIIVAIVMTHVYLVSLPTYSSRRRGHRHRRQHSVPLLEQLNNGANNDMLNEISRLLLLRASDADSSHTDQASLSASSTTTDVDVLPSEPGSFVADSIQSDSNRLVHQLSRLYRLLRTDDQFVNASSTIAPPSRVDDSNDSPLTERSHPRPASAHIYTWQCSAFTPSNLPDGGSEVVGASANPTSMVRRRKPHKTDALTNSGTIGTGLYQLDVDVSYEAEDEQDDPIQPVRCRRRFRPRRPGLPLPYGSDSTRSASTTECSTSEASEAEPDDNCETISSVPLINWPPWVIPCKLCVICWRTFRPPVRLGALPCGHGFHEACIRRWLDTGALDCPVCRWPAHAPHLRQQRQMIGQLLSAVRSTLSATQRCPSPVASSAS